MTTSYPSSKSFGSFTDEVCPLASRQMQSFEKHTQILNDKDDPQLAPATKQFRTQARHFLSDGYNKISAEVFVLCTVSLSRTALGKPVTLDCW